MIIDKKANLYALLSIRDEFELDTPHHILRQLRNCAAHGNYALLEDGVGRTTGYIAWANVCKESWLQFVETGKVPLYPYEWNEGRLVLITDIVLGSQSARLALRSKIAELFSRRRAMAFVRENSLCIYRRYNGKLVRTSRAILPRRNSN
jgi:hemolysin-activating ACP:hemolysin acyltransferase